MSGDKYGAIKAKWLSGEEMLVDGKGGSVATLSDFWNWAHSDLLSNTERGIPAEYIVACALGIEHGVRVGREPYDLLSEEGIRGLRICTDPRSFVYHNEARFVLHS